MVGSTLLTASGTLDVSVEQLANIPTPPATATWFPVSHHQVFQSVVDTLTGAGFGIQQSRLTLARYDARFFATLDLTTPVSEGITLAVGVRNSVDKSFPIGFCCGTRVMVCDNLAFTSEIVVATKHTKFGAKRYREGISEAVLGLNQYKKTIADWVDRMKRWDLTDDAANSYLLQAFERGVIGVRLLPLVLREWRHPRLEDYRPRTGWSLWNCFTDVIGRTRQQATPAEAALSTIRLQKLLTPPLTLDAEVSTVTIPDSSEEGRVPMDPQTAWSNLLDAYSDQDWEVVAAHATVLLDWLESGGFPPQTAQHRPLRPPANRLIALATCVAVLDRSQAEAS
jgi:hypothetical protein